MIIFLSFLQRRWTGPVQLRLTLRLAPPEPGSREPGPHLLLQPLFLLVRLVLRDLLEKLVQARGTHVVVPALDAAGPVRVQHHDIISLVPDNNVAVILVSHQTTSSLSGGFDDQPLGDLVDGQHGEVDDHAGEAATHSGALSRASTGHLADAPPPATVYRLRRDDDLVDHWKQSYSRKK